MAVEWCTDNAGVSKQHHDTSLAPYSEL